MRYLVAARVKPGRASALARAIDEGTLVEVPSPGMNISTTWNTPDSMTMALFAGWRFVSARRHWQKNALTGRNTLSY